MASQFSRRAFIVRFASFAARLFNPPGAAAFIDPGTIYAGLTGILSGAQDARNGRSAPERSYCEHLTGYALAASRVSAGEAAQIYFERVLERRLFLARNNPHHKGHELLAALWRRSTAPGWADCTLVREAHEAPVPLRKPDGFQDLCARLAPLPRDISKGNPAASTRRSQGPLFLQASGARAELPEELSLWDAMSLSPAQLAPLEGAGWVSFRNLFIQAFEAANAPYAALLCLGLWPADWEDAVSTHQAKQLSAFFSDVPPKDRDCLPAWQEAWERGRRVSGFESAGDLWRSELGAALRTARIKLAADEDIESLKAPPERETEADFLKRLRLCREAGVIDGLEERLFRELNAGANAAGLASDPAVKARLKAQKITMRTWLEKTSVRVCDFVSKLDESIPIKG